MTPFRAYILGHGGIQIMITDNDQRQTSTAILHGHSLQLCDDYVMFPDQFPSIGKVCQIWVNAALHDFRYFIFLGISSACVSLVSLFLECLGAHTLLH